MTSTFPPDVPLVGVNLVPVERGHLARAAVACERLGFESIWMGEHIATPVGDADQAYPGRKVNFEPGSPLLEPLVALAHVAACTTSVRLGTGVLMLPVRDPLLTARAIATVDSLSGGRLEVGVGLGWMPEEYAAMGRDWTTRGARFEEFIEVLDGLLSGEPFAYQGKHFDIPLMIFGPASPRPRLHIGGKAPKAIARSARLGDGWIGGSQAAESAAETIAELREQRRAAGRELDDFDISLVLLSPPSLDELRRLRGLGVTRVIITPWAGNDGPPLPGATTDLDALASVAESYGLGEPHSARRNDC
jgi:probable F420-dependent oxidoreductase